MRKKGKRAAIPLLLAVCTIAVTLAVGGTAYAISQYLTDFRTAYPDAFGTQIDTCGICHINPAGGGARNPYGTDFADAAIGNHTFNATLGGTDSDGDGFTNDEEIAALTFPGDNTSFPAAVDNTAPTVTTVVPDNNATGVAVNTLVSATFSEAIDNTTVTDTSFVVTDPTDNVVAGAIAVSADNTTVTFTSSAMLADNTTYTATLTTAVTDLAGNPLADNVVWSFTTATAAMDTTPPTVQSISPTDGATGVTTTTAVTATFSEPVDQATVDNTSFVVTDPTDDVVAGTFGFAGNIVQFTPSAALAASTTYTATLTTAITDLAGNPLAGNVVWSFTTAATPSSESSNDNGGGCSVSGRSEGFGGGATLALLTLFLLFVATRRKRARGRR